MTPTKPKQKPEPPALDQLSYEQSLAELEDIVTSLETNKLALDETMSMYERGQMLTRHCVELLDQAELRVKLLSGDTLIDTVVEE